MRSASRAAVSSSRLIRAATEASARSVTSVRVTEPWISVRGAAAPSGVIGSRSCTKTLSLRIDEMGADHLDLVIDAGQGACKAQDLAHARIAGLEEPDADMVPEGGRIARRGDIALVMGSIHRVAPAHQVRARRNGIPRIDGPEPDQPERIVLVQPFAL